MCIEIDGANAFLHRKIRLAHIYTSTPSMPPTYTNQTYS